MVFISDKVFSPYTLFRPTVVVFTLDWDKCIHLRYTRMSDNELGIGAKTGYYGISLLENAQYMSPCTC